MIRKSRITHLTKTKNGPLKNGTYLLLYNYLHMHVNDANQLINLCKVFDIKTKLIV